MEFAKFSEESARSDPGGRKSPKNGNPENQRGVIPPVITVIRGGMTPLWFSGFPFFGDFWAPGPLLADSTENFSTERPVFVASPDRRVPKTWYGRFFAQCLANSKVQIFQFQFFSRSKTGIIFGAKKVGKELGYYY